MIKNRSKEKLAALVLILTTKFNDEIESLSRKEKTMSMGFALSTLTIVRGIIIEEDLFSTDGVEDYFTKHPNITKLYIESGIFMANKIMLNYSKEELNPDNLWILTNLAAVGLADNLNATQLTNEIIQKATANAKKGD